MFPENQEVGSRKPDDYRSFGRLKFAAQDVDEGLDGEFDEEKRLGDEIVAASHHGFDAVVKVVEAGDKDNGGFLVQRQVAQLGAEFVAGHARHVHVEKHEVELFFRKQLEGGLRVFDADGLELRFFERVNDGAAGNDLVVHDQDAGGGNFLFVGPRAAFKQEGEK